MCPSICSSTGLLAWSCGACLHWGNDCCDQCTAGMLFTFFKNQSYTKLLMLYPLCLQHCVCVFCQPLKSFVLFPIPMGNQTYKFFLHCIQKRIRVPTAAELPVQPYRKFVATLTAFSQCSTFIFSSSDFCSFQTSFLTICGCPLVFAACLLKYEASDEISCGENRLRLFRCCVVKPWRSLSDAWMFWAPNFLRWVQRELE